MSAFDPELTAMLKDLGFKAGDRPTAKDFNARLAAAELRGAQRQREATDKALRDYADGQAANRSTIWAILTDAADHLAALPIAASPEETTDV